MDAVLRKMQFRGNSPVVVLDAPDESEAMLSDWAQQATLIRDASAVDDPAPMVLRFVRTCADIERLAAHTVGLLAEDGLLFGSPTRRSPRAGIAATSGATTPGVRWVISASNR